MPGPHSGPYPTGDPNPTPEQMDQQAAWILGRMARRASVTQIAAELGVSRQTIYTRLKQAREGPRTVSRGRPWRTDVGYTMVHQRLRKTQGPATDRPCRGCNAQAAQWAYTNDDPDELVNDQGLRYSLDPKRYVPMCHACHVRFDAAHREAV